MTAFPKLPPGLVRDLKLALEILRGRRQLPGGDDVHVIWAALQLHLTANRLEQGLYQPAESPTPEEALP